MENDFEHQHEIEEFVEQLYIESDLEIIRIICKYFETKKKSA